MNMTMNALSNIGNNYYLGLTKWGVVVHKIKKSTFKTKCNQYPNLEDKPMTIWDAIESGKSLCNGCFQ